MLRLASKNDIDNIKVIAQKHTKELGFILRPALEEAVKREELIYEDETGAFCHYHTRKDGITTIYEICTPVEARGKGIGKLMLQWLPLPIRLKCPEDNESNKFYNHIGFILLGQEQGKKRRLNIWMLEKWR